jgi:hypothetical protein
VNIVEAVQKGMNGKYLFHDPSFSEPIFYRPITRYEHELAKIEAMEGCSKPVMEFLADQAALSPEPIAKKDLTESEILEYRTYVFDLMVNIVYHGTKDFQPEEYSPQTIKDSFMDVLGLAKEILEKSVRPVNEVVQLISSVEGQNLLTIHYVLHVPLVDEAWKLTPLQTLFLEKGEIKAILPKSKAATITAEDLEKDPEKAKEYLKALFSNV